MKLSCNTGALIPIIGEEEAIKLLASAGFDALDFSCFDMLRDENSPKLKSNYREYAKKLLNIANQYGVYFNQAHAPFPSSKPDEAFTEMAFERILRCIEMCSILGVENVVVHPKQHLKYSEKGNPEKLLEMNLQFYNRLIPYCRDYNVHVAAENMWQYDDNQIISHSTCSKKEEFKQYLSLIDSPWIVGCLDIGHANLMGDDIPQFIHTLGSKLKCLHIHDTGHNVDLHLLPYTVIGEDKWDGILKALAEIGYTGDLTFEADSTLIKAPKKLKLETAEYMEKVGRLMIEKFESFSENV